jgi:ubiquinone/menaquinone biosynthesis C-methylase UbiE
MSEAQEFWDDFAEEYAEIQRESKLPIATDLANYLSEIGLLPTPLFVDLAAGSGRYIPAILPAADHYLAIDFSTEMLKQAKKYVDNADKVTYRQQSQADFLKEDAQYPLVFTAMNPALTQKEQLLTLIAKSQKLLILRIVRTKENVFQPLERVEDEAEKWQSIYKQWLESAGIGYVSHEFSYIYEEPIERDFFWQYFEEEFPKDSLQQVSQSIFGDKDQVISRTEIAYELLII